VFRAYSQFGVTIIRMVEKAGINKAFTAIPYIQENTTRDVLQLCIETPYYGLRGALQRAYPQSRDRHRRSRSKEELRRAAERRALQVIVENENGMIGDPGMFVPRQYRQHAEDELRAHEVFEIAMRRLGAEDRDAFFMQVVELVANTWLTKDDRQAVEQLLSEQRY
jgi:DNA repair photolyase